MASAAKIASNRRNAEKSCGPKTAEGKAVSRFNALQHGLTAKVAVLADEDPAEFESLRASWMERSGRGMALKLATSSAGLPVVATRANRASAIGSALLFCRDGHGCESRARSAGDDRIGRSADAPYVGIPVGGNDQATKTAEAAEQVSEEARPRRDSREPVRKDR